MKTKKYLKNNFFFYLIFTNLCSVTLGAYSFQENTEQKHPTNIQDDEAVIQIPAKLFMRPPKSEENYKEVTVRDNRSTIIFSKAKLLTVLPNTEGEYPLAEIVVKKNQLNQNLNLEYFQLTPHQPPVRSFLTKNKGEIHEITF